MIHALVKKFKILRKNMFVGHKKQTKKTTVYRAADVEQTLEGIFTADREPECVQIRLFFFIVCQCISGIIWERETRK